ncbi:MAG: hypothetical protein N2745_08385 [Syntrophorhabdaceae bacterium]|nr:hypothetical protein [Syntrophorhabdaceae bacterium]
MERYGDSGKKEREGLDSPILKGQYEVKHTQRLAVLFTDVVGSTMFFKTFGDTKGRIMLQKHYEIAEETIREYGGRFIKAIGDSVMACYGDPVEAFKSAIKMQEIFKNKGLGAENETPVKVKIGIHLGDVIVEDRDIFGDVVNLTAKITEIAEGGYIFVSQDVFELVKDMPSVNFEMVQFWKNKWVSKDFNVYKASWEDGVDIEPSVEAVIFITRFPLLDRNLDLSETIKGVLDKGEGEIEKKDDGGAVRVCVKKGISPYGVSFNMLNRLMALSFKDNKDPYVPVSFLIDVNKDIRGPEGYPFEGLMPCEIYVTSDAKQALEKYMEYNGSKIDLEEEGDNLYRVKANLEKGFHPFLFLFRKGLVSGAFLPCFYCGSRRHEPKSCPSKKLPEITNVTAKIGYQSIYSINRFFFKLIRDISFYGDASYGEDRVLKDSDDTLALLCFYELKRVFQPRFLVSPLEKSNEDWNGIRQKKREGDGGLLWLAYDSLRVGDIDKAEEILYSHLKEKPDEHRAFFLLGFINIERDSLHAAEDYFKKAINSSPSKNYRLLGYLLLSRLHMVDGDFVSAQGYIREALLLNPHSVDGLYLDSLLMFKIGRKEEALQRLKRLIDEHREFFVYALIDPELGDDGEIVDGLLRKILYEKEKRAKSILSDAEVSLQRTVKMVAIDRMADLQLSLAKAENAIKTDSYYGFLDGIYHGELIIQECGISKKEYRKDLMERIGDRKERIEALHEMLKGFRYKRFVDSQKKGFEALMAGVNRCKSLIEKIGPDTIKTVESTLEEIDKELRRLEPQMKRHEFFEEAVKSLMDFTKKFFLSISVTVFLGIFIIPLFGMFSNNASHNVSTYQRYFIIVGGFISLILSLVLTVRNIIIGHASVNKPK